MYAQRVANYLPCPAQLLWDRVGEKALESMSDSLCVALLVRTVAGCAASRCTTRCGCKLQHCLLQAFNGTVVAC